MKFAKAFLLIIVSGMLLISTSASAQDITLKITIVEGSVLVKISPQTEWVDAKVDQALNAKDCIKTLDNGRVYLEFPDKSSISLKPKTEISVEDLLWEEASRKVGISLSSGDLKVIMKKAEGPSEFIVKTPNAICGAHGSTIFLGYLIDTTSVYSNDSDLDLTYSATGEMRQIGAGTPIGIGPNGFFQLGTPPDTLGFLPNLVAEPYTPAPGGEVVDIAAPEAIADSAASQI
jgi:hypothetical protein